MEAVFRFSQVWVAPKSALVCDAATLTRLLRRRTADVTV